MATPHGTRRRESCLMGDLEQAAAFLFQEARHLDKHEWDAWVSMYREDAVYWLPAWRDEYETTADPQTEVSLIFHNTRLGLEERIARIEVPQVDHGSATSAHAAPDQQRGAARGKSSVY